MKISIFKLIWNQNVCFWYFFITFITNYSKKKCLIEKGLELSPSHLNHSNDSRKIFTLLAYIYQLTKFGGLMSCGSKDVFKNAPCLMYEYSSWRHRFGKSWDG